MMPRLLKNMSPGRAAYERVSREIDRTEREIRIVDDLDVKATERLNKKLEELKKQAEDMTEPCTGEVHSTGGDGCGLCMGITWGRMLKQTK
jgi:hypothetical protein